MIPGSGGGACLYVHACIGVCMYLSVSMYVCMYSLCVCMYTCNACCEASTQTYLLLLSLLLGGPNPFGGGGGGTNIHTYIQIHTYIHTCMYIQTPPPNPQGGAGGRPLVPPTYKNLCTQTLWGGVGGGACSPGPYMQIPLIEGFGQI